MTARATGLGSPRNGMEWKPYVWRGKPSAAPGPVERPRSAYTPGEREARQAILARILSDLPDDVLAYDQAARIFGVTKRTIKRDLQAIRATREAS